IYWVTRTLRHPVAQPAQIERCNKRMADSLSNGHKSPRRDWSASCSPCCSLGTRWRESRTGCPAFLSKFIVIGGLKMKILLGNIFDSKCSTLVNTVNCVGVMGKGIALDFKKKYPSMF